MSVNQHLLVLDSEQKRASPDKVYVEIPTFVQQYVESEVKQPAV